MATSNRIRALNRLPFDFQDGLKVGGVDVTALNQTFTPAGAGLVGFTPVGNLSAGNVQAALAELESEKAVKTDLSATTGSSLVGYDGGTVQDVMDSAKPMADYTALRAYTGRATSVRITSNGIAGFFYYDAADTTSVDNGGTIIVSSNGKRWKRLFDGTAHVSWFGAKGDWNGSTGTDDTQAIQNAINAVPYGVLNFGGKDLNFKITSPITINTDSQAGISRRDRRLIGYGAIVSCVGASQVDGFVFSSTGPWPATSFSLFMEGFTFGGTVSRAFVSFPDADNFYEQMQFERITTTNAAVGELFFFQNGDTSNLGGVTIRKCSGGPNTTRLLHLKGSTTYGQFDDWTIEDCFHLGTGSFLYLDGTVATTVLQYSQIRRCFTAGFGIRGISGANQFITHSVISNFYAEPKGTSWVSVECELIGCTLQNIVNTVFDFTGKDIKVLSSGSAKDTEIINCKSYNGVSSPWEAATYIDVSITYPVNVSLKGLIEQHFNKAVSFSKPYIYPSQAQSVRLCNAGNDGYGISTTASRTLYTFTNSQSGVTYDQADDIFEINVAGQLYGGVTNFTMAFELFDGTNTDTLATITTSTLNNNARHFRLQAIVRVNGTVLQVIDSFATFANATFTRPPYTYAERGLCVRANNPVLRANVSVLNAQLVEINYIKIERNRRVGTYTVL